MTTEGNMKAPDCTASMKSIEASLTHSGNTQRVGNWRVSIETFTPERAGRWLSNMNHGNRDVRNSHVSLLAGIMKRGEFALTPEALIVSKNNRLLNGQHRLAAVIQADVAIQFVVFWNVEEEVFEKIDQGTRRRMDDLFRTDKRVQEPINAIARMHAGNGLAADQVKKYLYVFGPACESLIHACGSTSRGRSSSGIKAGISVLMTLRKEIQHELTDLYRHFVLLNFDALPPSVIGLLKQLDSGKANTSRTNETIIRAFRAFNPENWSASRVQINDWHIGETKIVIDQLMS